MRRCTCDRFIPGEPYEAGRDCRPCWLYGNDPGYRKFWGGPPLPNGRRVSNLPCVHLGADTGEKVPCKCRDGTDLKVFACAVNGKCTIGRSGGYAVCQCPDYARFEKPVTRNLIYHLMPACGISANKDRISYHDWPGNGVWQWNVRELRRRLGLFNGKRVVAIVTGPHLDPPDEVRAAFGNADIEFVEVANDPDRREVATFQDLFSRVISNDPGEVTMFAHGKGVTRLPEDTAGAWTQTLYEVYLDYWPLVERTLMQFPLAGAFKKLGRGWTPEESASEWHYSGSWFWFRNRELFSKDWRRIDNFWSGIEPYPSLHFPVQDAGCLFHQASVDAMNLFIWPTWTNTVLPALVRWRAEHQADYKTW